jgi:hypothetical protein
MALRLRSRAIRLAVLFAGAAASSACGSHADERSARTSQPLTELTTCGVITTPDTYVLTADLAAGGTQTECLQVQGANPFTLDCQGHSVTGQVTGTSGAPALDIQNTTGFTVKNCTFLTGVNITSSANGTFSGNTLGTPSGWAVPLSLGNVHDVTVDSNTIHGVSAATSSFRVTYSANTISIPTGAPFAFYTLIGLGGGWSNRIVNNTLDGKAAPGSYYPTFGADDCISMTTETADVIDGNTIENVWDCGIEIAGTSTSPPLVSALTVSNNTFRNASNIAFGGFYWADLINSNVVNNTIEGAPQAFMFTHVQGLATGENGIYFTGNSFIGNTFSNPNFIADSAYFPVGGYTSDCGNQNCVAGTDPSSPGTPVQPDQFFVLGNTFLNNNLGAGPSFGTVWLGTPAIPGAVLDLGYNTCQLSLPNSAGQIACNATPVTPPPPVNAVDIVSSVLSGGATACNGSADGTGAGLAYSGTAELGSDPAQDWRYVLAQIYGGLDITSGQVDCNGAKRQALVSNFSGLFQNQCANAAAVCGDATHLAAGDGVHAPLWHAFRLDDASDASKVFAALLGLTPAPDATALNGFGTSPYCNALNWDASAENGADCALGKDRQFVGPGGVLDPAASDGVHRRPPPGTWGDNPDPSSARHLGADVMPTSYQDNDPIRRPCLGGATNNVRRPGEEVCNIDGTLGVVLSVPATDFIAAQNPGLVQYPVNGCTGFALNNPPRAFTCAPRGAMHFAECPNGDAHFGGQCEYPVDTLHDTAQCVAKNSTVPGLMVRDVSLADGRAFNLHMRAGTAEDEGGHYVQQVVTTSNGTASLDFAGAFGRIHQVQTVYAAGGFPQIACTQSSASDQIACLTRADPCSVAFAGDSARTDALGGVDAVRVAQVYPTGAGYAVTCGSGFACQ